MSSAPRSLRPLVHALVVGAFAAAALFIAAFALDTDSAWPQGAFAALVVLAAGAHVALLSGGRTGLRVARAFTRRGWQVFLSYRFQVVLVLAQLLVFAGLIVLLGRPLVAALFAPVGGALADYTDTNYVVFLLLGLAFFPILWSSYQVSAARIREEQVTGTFETLIATRAGVGALPFAHLATTLVGSVLGVAGALVVFATLLPPGALRVADPLALAGFLAILALGATTMWGLGLVMGGLTTRFKQAQPASSLLRILLLVFGGVYIPPSILPEWGRALSHALPITYAGEGVRAALAEGAAPTELLPELGALAAFALVASVGGMWSYRRLLDRARWTGTLGGY